ncbi:hypothetical protein DPX16_2998 [Anabarilius grahami]|uniref:Uncharacterized protein n=1 Tax=Anabarilius grahami TaxID=495550 RepID=A0A3N0XKF9_ANAGA|nr:hypothetical protein DPX16_2998 [Anabarilius grahami]
MEECKEGAVMRDSWWEEREDGWREGGEEEERKVGEADLRTQAAGEAKNVCVFNITIIHSGHATVSYCKLLLEDVSSPSFMIISWSTND